MRHVERGVKAEIDREENRLTNERRKSQSALGIKKRNDNGDGDASDDGCAGSFTDVGDALEGDSCAQYRLFLTIRFDYLSHLPPVWM